MFQTFPAIVTETLLSQGFWVHGASHMLIFVRSLLIHFRWLDWRRAPVAFCVRNAAIRILSWSQYNMLRCESHFLYEPSLSLRVKCSLQSQLQIFLSVHWSDSTYTKDKKQVHSILILPLAGRQLDTLIRENNWEINQSPSRSFGQNSFSLTACTSLWAIFTPPPGTLQIQLLKQLLSIWN